MKNLTSTLKQLGVASAMALYGATAFAGSLSVTDVNPGDAATAAGINGLFAEVETAVNDNDSRINDLTGDKCASGSITGEYKFVSISIGSITDPTNGLIGVQNGIFVGDLVFNSDNTWTFQETSVDEYTHMTGFEGSWYTTVSPDVDTDNYTINTNCKITLLDSTGGGSVDIHMTPDLYSGSGKLTEDQPFSGPDDTLWRVEMFTITKKNL